MAQGSENVIMEGGAAVPRDLLHDRCRAIAEVAGVPSSWAIVALLSTQAPTGFSWKNARGLSFAHCATTDHIGQRIHELIEKHSSDREHIRDERIRPLRVIGVVECVIRRGNKVHRSHLVPNSSDNGYRLSKATIEALIGAPHDFEDYLTGLKNGLHSPSDPEDDARGSCEASEHMMILERVIAEHLPKFHAGFDLIWIDSDGGSLSAGGRQNDLAECGFSLDRGDAIPDIVLFDPTTRRMRFVEAIASGGEPDTIKHQQLLALCARWNTTYDGTVCAYKSRKKALARRSRMTQAARLSHAWSVSDPDIIDAAVSAWPGA
ncbi:BsuBI/PstI family type II restriction endonuclease [Loktanella sp. DJP18]|uniref:BsuBI/PstI family type II restriction endonuclease n=1 Tax=Loktanella sp. DJP18 TaxID=3409788 RepID=UPI003BB54D91